VKTVGASKVQFFRRTKLTFFNKIKSRSCDLLDNTTSVQTIEKQPKKFRTLTCTEFFGLAGQKLQLY